MRQLEVVLGATGMPRNIFAHELHEFRASECKTELVRVMPSAAENVKEMGTKAIIEVG